MQNQNRGVIDYPQKTYHFTKITYYTTINRKNSPH